MDEASIGWKQNKRRYDFFPPASLVLPPVGRSRYLDKLFHHAALYRASPLTLGRLWHEALEERYRMTPIEDYKKLVEEVGNIMDQNSITEARALIRMIHRMLNSGLSVERITHSLLVDATFVWDEIELGISKQLHMTKAQYEIWVIQLVVSLVADHRDKQRLNREMAQLLDGPVVGRRFDAIIADDLTESNQARIDGPLGGPGSMTDRLRFVGTETGRFSAGGGAGGSASGHGPPEAKPPFVHKMDELQQRVNKLPGQLYPGMILPPPVSKPATMQTLDDLQFQWNDITTKKEVLSKAIAGVKLESDPQAPSYYLALLNLNTASVQYVDACDAMIRTAERLENSNMNQGQVNAAPRG